MLNPVAEAAYKQVASHNHAKTSRANMDFECHLLLLFLFNDKALNRRIARH